MSTTELRDLDAWICEHVMGWRKSDVIKRPAMIPNYSTSSAAAMEVLKKCQDIRCLAINKNSITSLGGEDEKAIVMCDAPTLELAICMFAKKLFTK